jgi:hypothetical protein
MPVALADGPLGLEASHVWHGGIDGGNLTLNELSVFPRYRLTRIRGLFSAPEFEDEREPAFAQSGEFAYPSLMRGKTAVYEGLIEANTLQEIRQMRSILVNGFSGQLSEGRVEIHPHPDYGILVWEYNAKCTAVEVEDVPPPHMNRLPTKEVREFTVTLRLSDPRFYVLGTNDTGAQAAAFSITNTGLVPTDPLFVIDVNLIAEDGFFTVVNESIEAQFTIVFPEGTPEAGKVYVDFKTRKLTYYPDSAPATEQDIPMYFNNALTNWTDRGMPGLVVGLNALSWTSSPAGIINTVQVLHRTGTL